MKTGNVLMTTVICIVLLAAGAATGHCKDQWTVNVGAGVTIYSKADNLWGNGKKTIGSLDDEPKSSTRVLAFPSIDLKYKPQGEKQKAGTEVYLNAGHLEPGSIVFGAKQNFGKSFLDVYGFYSLVSKAWENPYVLYRESTDAKEYGGRITYGNVLGTDFSLSYRLTVDRIDNDVIGDINGDLRRNGTAHRVTAAYQIRLTEGLNFIPGISYEKGLFNGESNSYDKYGGHASIIYGMKDLRLIFGVTAFAERYDKTHPVFDKTRRGDIYSVWAGGIFENPFGLKRYFLAVTATGSKTYSNIAFFDGHALAAVISGGYRF